jgi:hypothetical protein
VKTEDSVDLLREFVDLYDREEIVAFFEFGLAAAAGSAAIQGLCRISQPKGGRSNLYYLSLGFVADALDDGARQALDTALARLDGDAVRSAVPNAIEVLPVTEIPEGPEKTYARQLDILLDEEVAADPVATLAVLVPAVAEISGIDARDLVLWPRANGR